MPAKMRPENLETEDRIKELRGRQVTLMAKLKIKFDENTFRELNLINQKIEAAKARQEGEWSKMNYAQTVSNKINN